MDNQQQSRDLGRKILAVVVIALALSTVVFLGRTLISSLTPEQSSLASSPNQSPFVLIGMTQMHFWGTQIAFLGGGNADRLFFPVKSQISGGLGLRTKIPSVCALTGSGGWQRRM